MGKQERQCRIKEVFCSIQETLSEKRSFQVDGSVQGCQESPWPEGLRSNQEGHSLVHQGKGPPQEMMAAIKQAMGNVVIHNPRVWIDGGTSCPAWIFSFRVHVQ